VVLPDRVTPEQAAVVFRRAAELDAASGRRAGGFDDRALEDAGLEVGFSQASISEALAELRAGVLTPGPPATWGTVSSSRTVPGDPADLVAAIDHEARRNLLGVRHRVGDVAIWTQSPGTGAALARGLRGRRHHPLVALRALRATVDEVPSRPGMVRVRLEGSLIAPWRLLTHRAQTVATIGIGGGALVAVAAGVSWPGPDWPWDVSGALAALAGTGIGLRSYRRGLVTVETALDRVLDRLAVGPPAPATVISEDRVPLR
jgi:hypothetical protein